MPRSPDHQPWMLSRREFLKQGIPVVVGLLLEPRRLFNLVEKESIRMGNEFPVSDRNNLSPKEAPLILAVGKKTGEEKLPIIAGWVENQQIVLTKVDLDDGRSMYESSLPLLKINAPHPEEIVIPPQSFVNIVDDGQDYKQEDLLKDRNMDASSTLTVGLFPSLLAYADNRFLLFYSKYPDKGRERAQLFSQAISSNLSLVDKEVVLGEPTEDYSYQLYPKAANSPNGTKLVVWVEIGNYNQPESRPIVVGRFLDAENEHLGEPFIIFAQKYSQAPQVIYDRENRIFWVTSIIPYLGKIGGGEIGFYAHLFVRGVQSPNYQTSVSVITESAEDVRTYGLSENPSGPGWQVVWDEWSRTAWEGKLVRKVMGGNKEFLLRNNQCYLTSPKVAFDGKGLVYEQLLHPKNHRQVFFSRLPEMADLPLSTPSVFADSRTSSLPVIVILPGLEEESQFPIEKPNQMVEYLMVEYLTVFRRGSGTYFLDSSYVHGRLVTVKEHIE